MTPLTNSVKHGIGSELGSGVLVFRFRGKSVMVWLAVEVLLWCAWGFGIVLKLGLGTSSNWTISRFLKPSHYAKVPSSYEKYNSSSAPTWHHVV